MDKQRPLAERACTLHLYIQDRFDSEIEALRRSDFELAAGTTRVRDAFDECSIYMLARVGDELVGAVRMTQPPAVLRGWLRGSRPVCPLAHHGSDVVEFTRGVVCATVARPGNLSTAHMCQPCCAPARRRPSPSLRSSPSLFRDFLRLLGFRECGRPQIFHDGPGCRTFTQYLELDLAAARAVAALHMARPSGHVLQSKHIEVAFGDQATSAALA